MPKPEKPVTPSTRVEIYDTTLRDGSQGEGISFSLLDKLKITQALDELAVDFIEGGFPSSNPKDEAYFEQVRSLPLKHAVICAFGMTRRKNTLAHQDAGLQAMVASQAPVCTIVGKTWDLHVDQILHVSRQENLQMIAQSLDYCRQAGRRAFYDAEHFFDGYRANRDYAMQTLQAAIDGGAERLILCDTNGGSLPSFVHQVVGEVCQRFGSIVGVHVHNDGGLAVANSLAGVQAGAIQVQGTINGIGERCGNVDLLAVAANVQLKLAIDCLKPDSLAKLTRTSRIVYELANLNIPVNQPFVGPAAFAHKGGMHVHAVQQVAHSYEHVSPESVGNRRRVLVSELSGVSNVAATLGEKFADLKDKELQRKVVHRLAELEHQGYQFEAAPASFELLVRRTLGQHLEFWKLDHYRCVILKNNGHEPTTEATVKLRLGETIEHHVAEGDGPVNALDGAMRRCLLTHFPKLAKLHLRDFKVRVVNATAESAAKVRVVAEFVILPDEQADPDRADLTHVSTTGVSENIVDASWQALSDAFTYHLLEEPA